MSSFRARLFGDLEIARDDHPLESLPSRSTGSLLALLLINRGRPVPRDRAAAELWPGRSSSEARKALRSTLWRLGKTLAPDPCGDGEPVSTAREQIRLADPERWEVDLWRFEDRLEPLVRGRGEIEKEDHAKAVAGALDLHWRPFLEGFRDRWCEDRRHRTRLMWLTGLEALVRYRRTAAQWESVLLEADLVLRVDPLRETMHRELMYAHYARGDRPSALLRYERCRELLREELGVAPMPLTRKLHGGILEGVEPGELARFLED